MSFSESLNESLRRSIAVLFISLSFASVYLAKMSQSGIPKRSPWPDQSQVNGTESVVDFTRNELLTGSSDPFFWFLLPIFGVVSVGLCVAINYTALTITHVLTWVYSTIRSSPPRNEDGRSVALPISKLLNTLIIFADERLQLLLLRQPGNV
jgi:GPI inositol-deacylase